MILYYQQIYPKKKIFKKKTLDLKKIIFRVIFNGISEKRFKIIKKIKINKN